MTDWGRLLDEHGNALLLYARQWTNSRADAEDAVQEGFARFWRSWERGEFNHTNPPVGLLYAHVKRSALDSLRSQKRRIVREEKAAEDLYGTESMFESGLDRDDRRQCIEQALRELPEEQREVVVMKIWGELTFREIAESLNIPQDTAASRYRYALKTLGKSIGSLER